MIYITKYLSNLNIVWLKKEMCCDKLIPLSR